MDELVTEQQDLVWKSEDMRERTLKLKDELSDQKTLNLDLEQQSDKLHFLMEKHKSCLAKLEESRSKAIQARTEASSSKAQIEQLKTENGQLQSKVKELSAMVSEWKLNHKQEPLLNPEKEIEKELAEEPKHS